MWEDLTPPTRPRESLPRSQAPFKVESSPVRSAEWGPRCIWPHECQPIHHACSHHGCHGNYSDSGRAVFLPVVTAKINLPRPIHRGRQAVSGKVVAK